MRELLKIVKFIDAISVWPARQCCWLVIPLMVALVYEVISRKFFTNPTVWAMDTSYMLTGTLGMAGSIYALHSGSHICSDFISQRWPIRVQATVNLCLYLLCFFPGLAIFLWYGWGFAYQSWLEKEVAISSAWLFPIYPLKMVMVLGIALLLLQGVSQFVKQILLAITGKRL